MVILALDVATVTGFAFGKVGSIPTSGSVRLKSPDDESGRACRKLGIWLRDQFTLTKPDLVVVEAPLNIGGVISNPATISLLHRLVGGVETICGPYGVRCASVNVQTVRRHFIGKGRPPNPKQEVLERCKQLGWIDKTSKDHDRADALALWDYAQAKFGLVA